MSDSELVRKGRTIYVAADIRRRVVFVAAIAVAGFGVAAVAPTEGDDLVAVGVLLGCALFAGLASLWSP